MLRMIGEIVLTSTRVQVPQMNVTLVVCVGGQSDFRVLVAIAGWQKSLIVRVQ